MLTPTLRLPPDPQGKKRRSKAKKEFENAFERSSGRSAKKTIGGRFRLEGQIGSGAMGKVYLAQDLQTKSQIAVKLVNPVYASKSAEDIASEARIISKINHENLVRILEAGVFDKDAFVAMELLKGPDLRSYTDSSFRKNKSIPLDTVKKIILQACSGLGALHKNGIIHSDVKGENIIINAEGNVKIFDFEVSRFVFLDQIDEDETRTTGIIVGTPSHLSPEKAAGRDDFDHRSDIYSLGVVLYKMLCGLLPFDAEDTVEYLEKHRNELPIPPKERKPGLNILKTAEEIVLKALEKDPSKRFQSMDEMRLAVEAV